jgi:hypothetical protein
VLLLLSGPSRASNQNNPNKKHWQGYPERA